MPEQVDTSVQDFLQLYGAGAWTDWKRLLAHFDLGKGFSFLVLLLPGAVGADICRRQLASHLAAKGNRLAELPCEWREEARRVGDRLFALEPAEDLGGVWLGSVIPESDPEIEAWKEAWRFGLSTLNQQRNPLQRRFACPLVLVGAPWLHPLLRESAPDLWSIRVGVVTVKAARGQFPPEFSESAATCEPRVIEAQASGTGSIDMPIGARSGSFQKDAVAADPDYALERAESIVNQPGSELARAELLFRAGNGFHARARLDAAERCFRESVAAFNSLYAVSPGIGPQLAGALINLSNILGEVGRWEEALPPAERAVDICREWAGRAPDDLLPQLAGSLNSLASALSDLERREEALSKSEEALQIFAQLAKAKPDRFLPDLAMSLNNTANMLSALGKREAALDRAREAEKAFEQLAKSAPDAFLSNLATSRNNLAAILVHLGLAEEALAKARDAEQIFDRLAKSNPESFLPGLAMARGTVSTVLSELGRRQDALAKAQDAERDFRRLALTRPDACMPLWAKSLNILATALSSLDRRDEALTKALQAVSIYEQLAKTKPDAFSWDLAISLNNLSFLLSSINRPEEALAKAADAARILSRLAETRPEDFLPDLAKAKNNLALRLITLGRHEEALAAAREAALIYDRLAEASPGVYSANVGVSSGVQGGVLGDLNRFSEAATSFAHGLRMLLPVMQESPQALAPLAAKLRLGYLRSIEQARVQPDKTLLDSVAEVLDKANQRPPS
jgi:hypothetical protein